MSKRGENIYKRKDNRWEGRYIKEYDDNGKARFGYIYAKSYREAKEKLSDYKHNVRQRITSNKKLFSLFCDEWITLSRNRVKNSTYIKYRGITEKYIKPSLGSFLPQNISTVIIEKFSNKLLLNKLSTKTVRDILTIIKTILKYCKRQIGPTFPDIEIVLPKENKTSIRVLSLEEQTKFIRFLSADMDETKFGVLLSLLTGMRIGEICALRWQDISLEKKTIQVSSSMQRLKAFNPTSSTKTTIVIGETKSHASDRIIPLTNYAISLCKKIKPKNNNAFVLTGSAENFIEPRTLQYKFRKYTEACNLQNVHFHVLRHTFATRCVEVGFEIKSLSEILGHSSVKITLDRYVHSSLELKKLNMDKLAAIGF